MKQKPKRKKSVIVRLLVIGVSFYMVATLVGLGNVLAKDLETLDQLILKRDALKFENDELRSLLESDSHAAIIEKAARERLGFVYSDEEIYYDISGN